MPGQFHALAPDLEGVAVGECDIWRGPGRAVVAQQQAAGLLVPDVDYVAVEQRGGTAMVVVVVGVDQVGHPVGHAVGGGHLVDGAAQVAADGRGRVEQHDAIAGGQERRLVGAVGDPVQVPLHAADVVALVVEGHAERGRGNRCVVGQVRGARGAGGW